MTLFCSLPYPLELFPQAMLKVPALILVVKGANLWGFCPKTFGQDGSLPVCVIAWQGPLNLRQISLGVRMVIHAPTHMRIWAWSKWAQVVTSYRNYTPVAANGVAAQLKFPTCVNPGKWNLYILAFLQTPVYYGHFPLGPGLFYCKSGSVRKRVLILNSRFLGLWKE